MSQPEIVLIGGAMAGLTLAIALKRKLGLLSTVYEGAPSFDDGAGGAFGLYPNGLKVIREIGGQQLLDDIVGASYPYLYRRWMHHDGEEVAVASEGHLEQDGLQSVGVRRWRLQKCLLEAAQREGVKVVFNKRLASLENIEGDAEGKVTAVFEDGTRVKADFLFGCDGAKSRTRECLYGVLEPIYGGITCLMGVADIPREKRGICFPTGPNRRHGVWYPVGPNEQVFQIYSVCPANPESWKTLTPEEAEIEKRELAASLRKDGWAEEFVQPVEQGKCVIRVGIRDREPVTKWFQGRVALVGDAAHPVAPYFGQGAMTCFEDVGVLALVAEKMGNPLKSRSVPAFHALCEVYQRHRLPRALNTLLTSRALGRMQLTRTDGTAEAVARELQLRSEVQQHGTLEGLKRGSLYNYMVEVPKAEGWATQSARL